MLVAFESKQGRRHDTILLSKVARRIHTIHRDPALAAAVAAAVGMPGGIALDPEVRRQQQGLVEPAGYA